MRGIKIVSLYSGVSSKARKFALCYCGGSVVLNGKTCAEFILSEQVASRKFPDPLKKRNLMARIKYVYVSATVPFKCTISVSVDSSVSECYE
jgi:hypothetical protein